jgi:pimeloyl-ACP methyl ester carboxylesterase
MARLISDIQTVIDTSCSISSADRPQAEIAIANRCLFLIAVVMWPEDSVNLRTQGSWTGPSGDQADDGGNPVDSVRATIGRFASWARLTAAVVIAAPVLAFTPGLSAGTAQAASTSGPVPSITWQRCPAGSAAAIAGGFTCATVTAPLDYRNPSGPRVRLAVVRHAATGPARRGVIFFNPGGPGGQGTVQASAWLGFFPKQLLRDFDIVSWDPRGAGASTAVQCFPDQAAEDAFLGPYANFASFPVGRAQQRAYVRRWHEFGKICAARNGALLRHVSTADTARDLNLLRQALGQARLNYLGVSYGTYLGATYANLFPRRVGRLVLDGNVAPDAVANGGRPDPRLSTLLRIGSDQGVARALAAFLRICGQRSTRDCAFSAGSPAATRAKWTALLAALRRAPISLGGMVITYAGLLAAASADLNFVQPFSSPVPGQGFPGWSGAAQGLQQVWLARNGPAGAVPGTQPGTPPTAMLTAAARYPGLEQGLAVLCDDAPNPPAGAFAGLRHVVLRRSGAIGLPDLWSDEPCASWPVHQAGTYSGPWNARTRPILVIGNTTDPSTPLREAIAMTHQLASARLLVVRGYGHTAFLNPSTCAGDFMTAYFRTGALPRAGTVCRQDLPPFTPPAG